MRCKWGINNALFQVAKESDGPILGVSCWLAPHPATQPESWYSWFQSWSLSFNQLLNNIRYLGRGGLRTNRYWIWKERQAEAQAAIWDDPQGYYFCNIVAVSPVAQGKGIGKLLFEAVTKKADSEGKKCYLESSKSVPNVAIYERMGFEMRKEMECRDGEDACMVCSTDCVRYLSVFFFFLLTRFSCTAWCGILSTVRIDDRYYRKKEGRDITRCISILKTTEGKKEDEAFRMIYLQSVCSV